MDAKQRYIREGNFELTDDFIDELHNIDIRTSIKIAKFIDDNIDDVEYNTLVSTILGGVVIDDDNIPVTFALEIIKDNTVGIILSDIKFISMDEYLDLLNLKLK